MQMHSDFHMELDSSKFYLSFAQCAQSLQQFVLQQILQTRSHLLHTLHQHISEYVSLYELHGQ